MASHERAGTIFEVLESHILRNRPSGKPEDVSTGLNDCSLPAHSVPSQLQQLLLLAQHIMVCTWRASGPDVFNIHFHS